MNRLLLLFLLFVVAPVAAQPMEAPSIPAAETAFDRGLRSYQVGQYGAAAESFRRSVDDFDYHQRTTAALLMEGKALYAAGELERAASAMTAFLRAYPRSRYAEAARSVRRAVQERLDEIAAVPEPADFGIALPMSEEDMPFTQALFNGVRLAVDEYNAANPVEPVRMVFRNSEGTAGGARQAVGELAQAGVEFAVGPLYSAEATAAGEAAERARLTLVAPLATDASVSAGRDFVFQANPTFEQRGQIMARYVAAGGVGDSVAVVAQANTFGETMAEAFALEYVRAGGEVAFTELLFNAEDWFRLPALLGDTLSGVDAFYLPVTGREAPDHAAGALRGFDQMTFPGGVPRIYGNTEWGQLETSRERASQYGTAFTSDFHVDERSAAALAFAERYEALAGTAPERLAYAGYDITRMALAQLGERRSEESLAETIRRARPFAGLGHRIYFGGGSVNEAMFILGFRDGRLVVIE